MQKHGIDSERTTRAPRRLSPGLAAGLCAALIWIGGFGIYLRLQPAIWTASAASAHSIPHTHQSVHGGMVQSVGDNHVEAVFDTLGGVTVYTLGRDETQMAPITATELSGEALTRNTQLVTPLTLRASPQYGETGGHASRFIGTLPPALRGQPLSLTLNVPLAGKLYRVRLEPDTHAAEPGMPSNPADHNLEAERKLFLTPAGLYTQADIIANGNTVPSIKYADFVADHNMNPQRGDLLCPITNTLASAKLIWTVGGKSYTFCCPPCLREFVQRAKTRPNTIKPPEDYVKR